MSYHKFQYIEKDGKISVRLDGNDMICRRIRFESGVDECPIVTLELMCDEVEIETDEVMNG